MATLITVTLTSGQSLGIATADLVYATNNGTDTILTIENYQTNPQQIRVTESLNAIVALDDSFLTVTTTGGDSYLLSGTRIKTCEDLTTFRQISYEGVGITNITYKVTDTLAAIIAAVNSAGGGAASRIIASLENVNLQTVAANVLTWASGKTAANTAPSSVVVTMAANDTYVDNSTAFQLELNTEQIFASGANLTEAIKTITLLYYVSLPLAGNSVLLTPTSGNWALPVTVGTLNDFRVNIYILGDSI